MYTINISWIIKFLLQQHLYCYFEDNSTHQTSPHQKSFGVYFLMTLDGAICFEQKCSHTATKEQLVPCKKVSQWDITHCFKLISLIYGVLCFFYRLFWWCKEGFPTCTKDQSRFWRCQSEPATDTYGPAGEDKQGILMHAEYHQPPLDVSDTGILCKRSTNDADLDDLFVS